MYSKLREEVEEGPTSFVILVYWFLVFALSGGFCLFLKFHKGSISDKKNQKRSKVLYNCLNGNIVGGLK